MINRKIKSTAAELTIRSHRGHTQFLSFIAVLIPLALVGCSDSDYTDPNAPIGDALYVGYWEQTGYGQYFDIGPEQVTRYEAATDSCIKTHTLPRGEFPANLNWTITEFNFDSFDTYVNQDTSDKVTLNRIEKLPASCATPRSNTPTHVVNHLIAMADDYYAFFNQRNIDWGLAANQARAQVHDQMNDQELAQIVIDLLSIFNDAHVVAYFNSIDLLQPEVDFSYFGIFVAPDNLDNRVTREYVELSPPGSLDEYRIQQTANFHLILGSYMDGALATDGGLDRDKIKWGTINQDIGYLQVGELDNFDPEYASDPFSEASNPAPHVTALDAVLEEAIHDLRNTSAIILDLRMHSGGTTALDLSIARRFIENEITYGSFYAPGAEKVPLILTPHQGRRLSQPMVIITSHFNASSGEDMVMALKANDRATQIGESTLGTFSDQLFLSLPNQWAFSLSNEVWLDENDINWEAQGLLPDYGFTVFPLSDRENGIDSAIERALSVFRQAP